MATISSASLSSVGYSAQELQQASARRNAERAQATADRLEVDATQAKSRADVETRRASTLQEQFVRADRVAVQANRSERALSSQPAQEPPLTQDPPAQSAPPLIPEGLPNTSPSAVYTDTLRAAETSSFRRFSVGQGNLLSVA